MKHHIGRGLPELQPWLPFQSGKVDLSQKQNKEHSPVIPVYSASTIVPAYEALYIAPFSPKTEANLIDKASQICTREAGGSFCPSHPILTIDGKLL